MNDESDFDLGPDQWAALKAVRTPPAGLSVSARAVLGDLVDLGLVTINDGVPAITEAGRKALIRGSFRLLDAAA
jgi:hypothetical protein